MHAVDRGPEPDGLSELDRQYTPGWVRFYVQREGTLPTDSHWRKYIDTLKDVFGGFCAYCEEIDRGEVDHFRPKSKFPHLVYTWANYVFACHDCNRAKYKRWPLAGYIDPCAVSWDDQPGRWFQFDTVAAFVKPREDLEGEDRKRAVVTIRDLKLNEYSHIQRRLQLMELVAGLMEADGEGLNSLRSNVLEKVISRKVECSSILGAMLVEMGMLLDDWDSRPE